MMFKYSRLGCFNLTLLILVLFSFAKAEQCDVNDEEFFVSFHPHLDAFWLNTDVELKSLTFRPEGFLFAMNQRNSKQIFDSMLDALLQNSDRKYFLTEAFFFKDWYEYLSLERQTKVKEVIKNRQLEIVNGGWVENDEAVCYVDDIIDQYTIGHNFLQKQFGIVPTIAWATDSFGHSHSQAAIEHLLGFEIQGIERIDDRYIFQRKNQSLLEFYWSAVSDSNGKRYGGVYTHIRHFLHEFVDYRRMSPQAVADDHSRIQAIMKKLFRRNKMFRFVGNDFQEFVPQEFQTLEKAMVNLNSDLKGQCKKAKYGNPSDYFKYIKKEEEVPVRESDFLPNFDQDHYWAGYYTTNPELKIICKDFSRLVNLYRKIYIKYLAKGGADDQTYVNLLKEVDQLLSIMQHHDGITATSKYHIEDLFKKHMKSSSDSLIKAIMKLKGQNSPVCSLYNNGNKCSIQNYRQSVLYLTILHEGAPKTERVELTLPVSNYYEAEEDKQDTIFCPTQGNCVLVFDAYVEAGENVIKLNAVDPAKQDLVVREQQFGDLSFTGFKFSVQIENAKIKFSLKNEEYIHLSFVRSANTVTNVDTLTWNKFGQQIRKNERRLPGIYIMANTGKIEEIPDLKFSGLKISEGAKYSKISVSSTVSNVVITVSNQNLSVLDVEATFKPSSFQMFDYFLKIDSSVKSSGPFFHDVNGYLVSQRKIGERLDYEWKYRDDDKINANTYPMCSFAYVLQGNRKMIVFTDRAQGVTLYDQSLLVNIDRLAGDDYKGVGEGYNKQINNTFKFKIGLIDKQSNLDRIWQRQYDEPLLAFSSSNPSSIAQNSKPTKDLSNQMLKYTVFSLNPQQFVLRLFNMNELEDLTVPKYSEKEWNLNGLGLNLKFQDIRESFANGAVLSERKIWKKITGQINIFTAGAKDTRENMVIEPLQIRSFRINMKEKITSTPHPMKPAGPQLPPKSQPVLQPQPEPQIQLSAEPQLPPKAEPKPPSDLSIVTIQQYKPLKVPFLKRCF